ncbi:restriction endonuclease subunit S, partial [Vibrio parahaemolyticus]|nr:restriction endonuclease subunit S [Vibrio parahaemolyticus]
MTSNYKKIGDYIRLVDVRNRNLEVKTLLGLSISKEFIPSVANTVGTDMANYKIIKKGQFACSLMQVRRDKKIPVALQIDFDEAIISQAYPVFEVVNTESLDPEYLMMWMSRSEFDRHACFLAVGGVRGSLEWDDFCDMELPVPSIEKQREIVREYNVVNDRIALNEQLTQKLEDTAQAIYKQWFVDFEFPISKEYAESIGKPELEGKPYKSSGGEMEYSEDLERDTPKAWGAIPIKSFTKEMKSGGTPKRDVEEYWNSKDVPWLKTGEVANCVITDAEEYISELGLKESSAKVYPKNTVLMAMYGDG